MKADHILFRLQLDAMRRVRASGYARPQELLLLSAMQLRATLGGTTHSDSEIAQTSEPEREIRR